MNGAADGTEGFEGGGRLGGCGQGVDLAEDRVQIADGFIRQGVEHPADRRLVAARADFRAGLA